MTRTHTVLVNVTFNKKCSRQIALRELRDTIHGNNYCTQFDDREPGEYRIRSVRLAPASKKPRHD